MRGWLVLPAVAATVALALAAGRLGGEVPRRVDVGGRHVRVLVTGSGPATVVLEAGMHGGVNDWSRVQTDLSRHARVFSYDRAGFGGSDVAPKPRHARQIAAELQAALTASGLGPPYVLVGHSYGGPLLRVFAHAHPEDVAGLVLVDPTLETPEEEDAGQIVRRLKAQQPDRAAALDRVLAEAPDGWHGALAGTLQSLEQTLDRVEPDRREQCRREWLDELAARSRDLTA